MDYQRSTGQQSSNHYDQVQRIPTSSSDRKTVPSSSSRRHQRPTEDSSQSSSSDYSAQRRQPGQPSANQYGDQQVNHLQINMVNDHRQIQPISLTGGRNHMPPLVDLLNNVPMTDTDNTNDLCKKEIKDRHHSSLLMHPTEIHLHIPPLSDPLSNVPLTDKDNTGSRRRNQDQQRNRTKASFLILIQKRYQGISLVIITINILPIKKYIVRFP